ncbi:hypothetical protein KGF54_005620 [Candida jiufengensis]|uniref:uncharacterized protein n=1 Tax=Candida jiufengensis TaxID=497108 RepID=UPI002224B57C|nr:uncharacterized protein KGF54_005620 [Candida jiufengensis]KAI5949385.1 hypothetical protein KGF54_005620 [Candida jiufengensis]
MMELKDLPIEITEQIIPKDQTILKLPTEQCIHWLNQFHPNDTLMILNAGFESEEKELYLEKFKYKIYLNFENKHINKQGRNAVIIDYNMVTSTISKYTHLFRYFQIWTGDTDWHSFVWLSKISLKILNRHNLHNVHLNNTDQRYLNGSFEIFKRFYEDNFVQIRSETEKFFKSIGRITVNLNYDQYQTLIKTLEEYNPNEIIACKTACIFIEPTKDSPNFFPVKSVTDYFKPSVQLTLYYFGPNTTVEYTDDLIDNLPLVHYLSLGFGQLEYERISESFILKLGAKYDIEKWKKYGFQVKVDKNYYEKSLEDKIWHKLWNIEIYDEYVILWLK